MRKRQESDEVLYSAEGIVRVAGADIAELKALARANPRGRVRLCAHANVDDALHEMLIVQAKGAYVPPHKHPGKTESMHLIEGRMDVIVFSDDGQVTDSICMGEYGTGLPFYYRLSRPEFHTLLIRSEVAVFHEVTDGPFRRGETVFAEWAPAANADEEAQRAYQQKLLQLVS